MTTVTTYRSTDASAPVLNGLAGSLISVLDGCLVTGYGAQLAAGWTKPFTGTNLASYRQGTGSNQYYLKVRDDGPGAAGARETRVRGFEVMTAVTATDTAADGTNPFPTVAQASTGIYSRKSVNADNQARAWIVVADARTFYMFSLTGDVALTYLWWGFGEYFSFMSSDPGRTMLFARSAENSVLAVSEPDRTASLGNLGPTAGLWYVNRDVTTIAGTPVVALPIGRSGDTTTAGASTVAFSGSINHTNSADRKSYVAPIRIANGSPSVNFRGRVRGVWHWQHAINTIADGETFTGTGDLAGKTFLVIKQSYNGGVFIVETSSTWDTN